MCDKNREKKIKILRVIARLNIGGPARHTILLSEGLDGDIFETVLIYGAIDKSEGDMEYLAQAKNIDSVIIPELGRKISWKNDLVALWKLYHLIKKERPDIIHTHTAKAGTLGRLAALLCKFSYRPKVIHTFHGHVLYGYFGKAKSKIFIWIERFLAKFTDKIVAINEKLKQDLLSFIIGSPKKITVIPLGLELGGLLALESTKEASKDGFSVGIIGRLVPIKNHRMFLEVAKRLRISNCEFRANFFIVGDGELKEKLREYAKELGVEENVVFGGWQEDLNKVYSNLDIVALTSLNEGTPVSLIEAMAAGKPVIATDVGGVRELLGSKLEAQSSKFEIAERGILVESGNVKGFTEGLGLLLRDKTLREKLAREGREFVRERFSQQRLIKDTESLYKELIA